MQKDEWEWINIAREFKYGDPPPKDSPWLWAQDQGNRELWLDIHGFSKLPPAVKRGWKHGTIKVFEQPPPNAVRLFQGRLSGDSSEYQLEWSMKSKPMRQIRDSLQLSTGRMALVILHQHVPVHDCWMLVALLHQYPNHIIEFTTFDQPVGKEGMKTLVWEVRNW